MRAIIKKLVFGLLSLLIVNLLAIKYVYAEIILAVPVSIIVFTVIFLELIKNPKERKDFDRYLPWVIICSLALFYEGIGMHGSSNYLSGLVLDIFKLIESNLLQMNLLTSTVYFFDEVLGHIIMFLGLFGIILSGILLQVTYPFQNKPSRWEKPVLLVTGSAFGLGLTAILIEGRITLMGLAAVALLSLLLFRIHKADTKDWAAKYPFNFHIMATFVTIITVIIIYAIIFQGLPELSVVGIIP